MTTPAVPPEPGANAGYHNLEELEGQVVDITAIEYLKGIPVAVVADQSYLCLDEWGEKGAGAIEAAFASSGDSEKFTFLIKRAANGEIGFAPPPTP